MSPEIKAFVNWFKSKDGHVDLSLIEFTNFSGQGRGIVALVDIQEDTTLFTIPRGLVLSTRTSLLPGLLGERQPDGTWCTSGLSKSWAGLIMCMMWEEAQGMNSPWCGYLASLPTTFTSPMFWSEDDLKELKGTSIVDKIGKEDAEREYNEKLLPVIHSRPDLFPPALVPTRCSLDAFHIQGSRILSRSFCVERWRVAPASKDGEGVEREERVSDGVDVPADGARATGARVSEAGVGEGESSDEGGDDSEDEGEDPSDVAMVPMADLLNARYGCENAKLFYERDVLKMVTTRAIKAGEQVYNTYGDPPNGDLLRRYGHVDLVPLDDGSLGNPADEVEIRADLVLRIARERSFYRAERDVLSEAERDQELKDRIEHWLQKGKDDVFWQTLDFWRPLPNELYELVHLLLVRPASGLEWRRLVKGTVPEEVVLRVCVELVHARLGEYPTATVEEDQAILQQENLSLNRRHAVVVRLGEKRILMSSLKRLQDDLRALTLTTAATDTRNIKRRKRG